MSELIRINSDGVVDVVNCNNPRAVVWYLGDGYKPRRMDLTPVETGEFERLDVIHVDNGDEIVTKYTVVKDDIGIKRQIDNLTAQLSSTDYKVVKNHEYIDAGLEPYYDPLELYNEREPIREQIRELETLL